MNRLTIFIIICALVISCGSPDGDLIKAIRKYNIVKVRKALKAGANVNTIDKKKYNMTPLITAAWLGLPQIVKLLISKGADINARATRKNRLPLAWSVRYDNKDIAELLISKGAELNLKMFGVGPLFLKHVS